MNLVFLYSKNEIINSKIYLFTNDIRIANLWTFNQNKNLIISDGFVNAIKDEKIIKNGYLKKKKSE